MACDSRCCNVLLCDQVSSHLTEGVRTSGSLDGILHNDQLSSSSAGPFGRTLGNIQYQLEHEEHAGCNGHVVEVELRR